MFNKFYLENGRIVVRWSGRYSFDSCKPSWNLKKIRRAQIRSQLRGYDGSIVYLKRTPPRCCFAAVWCRRVGLHTNISMSLQPVVLNEKCRRRGCPCWRSRYRSAYMTHAETSHAATRNADRATSQNENRRGGCTDATMSIRPALGTPYKARVTMSCSACRLGVHAHRSHGRVGAHSGRRRGGLTAVGGGWCACSAIFP